MLKAEGLIKKRQYKEAYRLIEGINHRTAVQWRSKIESILDEDLEDPFSESDATITEIENNPSTKRRLSRNKVFTIIGVLIVCVLICGIVWQFAIVPRINELYKEVVVEATTLQFVDSPNASGMNANGNQWEYFETDVGTFHIVTYATAFATASQGTAPRSLAEQNQYRTVLEVGCNGERYRITIRASSEMSTTDDLLYVTMIFDEDDPQTVVLDPSDSHETGFFKDEMESVAFLELAQSGELLVQMPTLTAYKYSKFNVSGFLTAVKPLISACGPLPS